MSTTSSKHIGTTVPPSQSSHLQAGPRLGNQYEEDSFLQAVLARLVPQQTNASKAEMTRLGDRVAGDLLPLARALDKTENQPRLVHYDAWGKRVDEIVVHPGWRYMHAAAAEEGIVADGYDGKYESRTLQFAKLLMFNPSSGLYVCLLSLSRFLAKTDLTNFFFNPGIPARWP